MVVDEVDEVELKEIDLIDMELDSMSYQKQDQGLNTQGPTMVDQTEHDDFDLFDNLDDDLN